MQKARFWNNQNRVCNFQNNVSGLCVSESYEISETKRDSSSVCILNALWSELNMTF